MDVSAGYGDNPFAQIGNGGMNAFSYAHLANATIAGDFPVTAVAGSDSPGNVLVAGGFGTGSSAFAQIGNGGLESFSRMTGTGSATITGNITVVASGDVVVLGGILGGVSGLSNLTVSDNYAQIGNGGARVFESATLTTGGATISGNIGVTALGGEVLVEGGSVLPAAGNYGGYGLTLNDAYAQIGNGGNYAFQRATLTGTLGSGIGGNVTVFAQHDVVVSGGTL